MTSVQISQIKADDVAGLVEWNAMMRANYTAGREAAWWRGDEATVVQFSDPLPKRHQIALLATVDGITVGGAEVLCDPGDPAEVEISVVPDQRRRGIGAELARMAARELNGLATTVQTETYCDEGTAFAEAHGMVIGNQEFRLLLNFPLEHPEPLEPAPGVTIHSWIGACPEHLLDGWASLSNQMDEDVPLGDLTRVVGKRDRDSVRRHEKRMDEQGWILVRSLAVRDVDSTPVGYTLVMVSREDREIIVQDNTLVDRSMRGQGIGRALKLANMSQFPEIPETSDARWIQTYTAVTNSPMLALNDSMGFTRAETMTALEGPVPVVD